MAEGEVSPHQSKWIILLRRLLSTVDHELLDGFEVQFVVEVCVWYVVYARVPIKTKFNIKFPTTLLLLIRAIGVERFLDIEVL